MRSKSERTIYLVKARIAERVEGEVEIVEVAHSELLLGHHRGDVEVRAQVDVVARCI
jgi:hypothetical protein